MFKSFKQGFSEKVTSTENIDKEMSISEPTFLPFIIGNTLKVFIYNLDIDLDGILGPNFLKHYVGVIDLKSKEKFQENPLT